MSAWFSKLIESAVIEPLTKALASITNYLIHKVFIGFFWARFVSKRPIVSHWISKLGPTCKNKNIINEPSAISSSQEFISLRDAATKTYTYFRETKHLYAVAAERLNKLDELQQTGSPDDSLDWIATLLAQRIKIYGKKNPSTLFELIEEKEIAKSKFTDGAIFLRDNFYDKSFYYTDLAVKASEFNLYLTGT